MTPGVKKGIWYALNMPPAIRDKSPGDEKKASVCAYLPLADDPA